jgi:hypothetical protein
MSSTPCEKDLSDALPKSGGEATAVPRQNVTTWLTVIAWLCLLWVFIAFCIIYATIDKINLKGDSETKNQPLELLFDGAFITGLAALPVGFICGLCLLLFGKGTELRILTLIPTLILGLLLLALAVHQYPMYRWWFQRNGDPATTAPTVHVIE